MRFPGSESFILTTLILAACTGSGDAPSDISTLKAKDQLVWSNRTVHAEAVPALDTNIVFFLEQEVHILSAVDRWTGARLWQRHLITSKDDRDGYGLAVVGDVLVVGDIDVFGIDKNTGAIRWTFHPSRGLYPGYNRLTTDGTTIYTGSTSGDVFAIDPATGAERWVTSVATDPAQVWVPTRLGDVIYVAFSQRSTTSLVELGGAAALDANSGALLWRTYLPQAQPDHSTENDGPVAVTPTLVVVGSTRSVYGLDRATGAIRFMKDSSVFRDHGVTHKPLIYTGRSVVVANQAPGTLTALDPTDMHVLWSVDGDGAIMALAADDVRVFVARIGTLDIYRQSDGKRLWRFWGSDIGTPDELYLAAPAFDSTRFYVPGSKGVYAFKKQ